jgi:hypothetical protein
MGKALDDLANKINVCATKADDYRVTAACHLAEAKRLCLEQGITFTDWVRDNIKLSYDEARKLATAGESGDPAKYIADMRERSRVSMARGRAVQRGTASRKPKPGVPVEIEHDDDDAPEEEGDEASMHFRGLAACIEQGWLAAVGVMDHVSWLSKHSTLDYATLEAVESNCKAWAEALAMVSAQPGVTFLQDGRSEVPVDDPTPELEDIPPELDRRKRRA